MTPIRIVRHIMLQRRQRRRVAAKTGINQFLRVIGTLLLVVVLVLMGIGAGGVSSVLGAYAYFTRDLPEPEAVQVVEEDFETTKIYDSTGEQLLFEIIDPTGGDRQWIPFDEIKDNPIICATVALEDRTFWSNPGFNPRGMSRALVSNIRGEQIQGGSSITQQLVKNVVIEPERRYISEEGPEWKDYERKITEVLLSHRITQKYSKEQILEWYLNTNHYGNLAYGIEAAAKVYFGKSAGELTLVEAATLAAIPQFPAMNPFDNPDIADERRGLVLDAMVIEGCITEEESEAAKVETLKLARYEERYDIKAPHFSVYVRKQLEQMPEIGPEMLRRGGLRVYTTLDYELNQQAQCVARTHIRRLSGEDEATVLQEAIDGGCEAAQYLMPLRPSHVGWDHEVNNAAVVVLRPGTGEILAMVGSLDYWDESIDGQFNVAVDGPGRQPGSSFKPFTYVTLLSQEGYSAAYMFLDVRKAFQQHTGIPYVPENYDRKYHGPQRLRKALSCSYNIPAVEALYLAGVDNTIRTAHRMGINTLDKGLDFYGLSLTLGGGEVHLLDMVYAFGVFANDGKMYGEPLPAGQLRPGFRELDPVAILRVEDRDGNVLYQYDQPEGRNILDPRLAYLMNNILSDRVSRYGAFSRPNPLELADDRPAAAKTGTTNNYKDAWTIGYTPQYAAGVWVGNSDNADMKTVAGVVGAAHIWHAVMEYAVKNEPHAAFTRPEGLVEKRVCDKSGLLPNEHCPTVTEIFIPGTEPKEQDTIYQVFRVHRETGLLCTAHTPPDQCEEKVFEVYPPEAADWIASLPEDRRPETPPTQYVPIGPTLADAEVGIISPAPYSYITGTVPITGNARGGDFNYYALYFGEGMNPTNWVQIGSNHGNQVDKNILEFWDTSGLDGLYTLRLQVVDHSAAVREAIVQVTVDPSPPEVDLTYPEDGSEYEYDYDEWANINAEVSDYSIARVEYYMYQWDRADEGKTTPPDPPEGLEPFVVRTQPPFNVNWTIKGRGAGKYTFYVIVVDAAGNSTTSDRVTIKLVPHEKPDEGE